MIEHKRTRTVNLGLEPLDWVGIRVWAWLPVVKGSGVASTLETAIVLPTWIGLVVGPRKRAALDFMNPIAGAARSCLTDWVRW